MNGDSKTHFDIPDACMIVMVKVKTTNHDNVIKMPGNQISCNIQIT